MENALLAIKIFCEKNKTVAMIRKKLFAVFAFDVKMRLKQLLKKCRSMSL